MDARFFSKREEITNPITHGIGALLSVAALVLLIVFYSLYGTIWHNMKSPWSMVHSQ